MVFGPLSCRFHVADNSFDGSRSGSWAIRDIRLGEQPTVWEEFCQKVLRLVLVELPMDRGCVLYDFGVHGLPIYVLPTAKLRWSGQLSELAGQLFVDAAVGTPDEPHIETVACCA